MAVHLTTTGKAADQTRPDFSAQFLPRTITLGIHTLSRKAIETQIEHLIELLDRIDGDADCEPDHEDYDACDLGEHEVYLQTRPQYDTDQSAGPINHDAAFEAEYAARCEQADLETHLPESRH